MEKGTGKMKKTKSNCVIYLGVVALKQKASIWNQSLLCVKSRFNANSILIRKEKKEEIEDRDFLIKMVYWK